MGRQIVGTFCEKGKTPLKSFDRRSLRWKRSGKAWLLIGCPRGKYDAAAEQCKVGTRAYKLLKPTRGKRCPVGSRKVKK